MVMNIGHPTLIIKKKIVIQKHLLHTFYKEFRYILLKKSVSFIYTIIFI